MQNDDRNRDEEMTLEEIINFLKSMPKSKCKIVDTVKYRKMQSAAEKCRELFCTDEYNDAAVRVEIIKEFNMGAITVTADYLQVQDIVKFSEAVKDADNFEIVPHTDGTLEFNLAFQGVLKSM